MAATSIEWADHSINPIRADADGARIPGHYCEKISPGCALCYASTLQKRFQMPVFPGKSRIDDPANKAAPMANGVLPFLDEKALDEIRKRRKPTRYFVGDMTDV